MNLPEQKKTIKKSQSRTGKLWIMYMTTVEIVKTFACGQRTCNLRLHLEAVVHMLPHFASSDHYNYASYVQINFSANLSITT